VYRYLCRLSVTIAAEMPRLSLHDALPICGEAYGSRKALFSDTEKTTSRSGLRSLSRSRYSKSSLRTLPRSGTSSGCLANCHWIRSEEHTSELQSRENLVCRLLLEKKKITS